MKEKIYPRSNDRQTVYLKNVITNSAEYGLIPQRDFFDKDIAVEGNTENYYVIENEDFVYNPRKSITAPYGPFNRYTLKDQGIISPLYTCLVLKVNINPSYHIVVLCVVHSQAFLYLRGACEGVIQKDTPKSPDSNGDEILYGLLLSQLVLDEGVIVGLINAELRIERNYNHPVYD